MDHWAKVTFAVNWWICYLWNTAACCALYSCHSLPRVSHSIFLISHNNIINHIEAYWDSQPHTHMHTSSVPWVMQWVIEYSNLSYPVSLASSYSDLDALQWSVCLCVTSLCLHLYLSSCLWLHGSVPLHSEAGGRRSRDKSAHMHMNWRGSVLHLRGRRKKSECMYLGCTDKWKQSKVMLPPPPPYTGCFILLLYFMLSYSLFLSFCLLLSYSPPSFSRVPVTFPSDSN